MLRQLRLVVTALIASQLLRAYAHYGQIPCQSDEVQAEVQGASGYLCAPQCSQEGYNCPTDVPGLANAQPQCMLQDFANTARCGLLCQVDSQCPSGAQCRTIQQMEVGICLYAVSFADWARQASIQKLVVGWPSQGGQSLGVQIAKTQSALQNMKTKYSIDDNDADLVILKDLLGCLIAHPGDVGDGGSSSAGSHAHSHSSASTQAAAQTCRDTIANFVDEHGESCADYVEDQYCTASGVAGPAWNEAEWGSIRDYEQVTVCCACGGGHRQAESDNIGLTHDVNQFANYASDGIPGFEREIHDTIWNIEHITGKNSAVHLLSGLMWFIFLYLGAGGVFKYQQGARGFDMIPHAEFWLEYPRLVNDGVLYSKILLGMTEVDQTLEGGLSALGFSTGSSGLSRGGAGTFQAL